MSVSDIGPIYTIARLSFFLQLLRIQWIINVNPLVFHIVNREYRFLFKNEEIEMVKEYKYLGILFSNSGSFYKK